MNTFGEMSDLTEGRNSYGYSMFMGIMRSDVSISLYNIGGFCEQATEPLDHQRPHTVTTGAFSIDNIGALRLAIDVHLRGDISLPSSDTHMPPWF